MVIPMIYGGGGTDGPTKVQSGDVYMFGAVSANKGDSSVPASLSAGKYITDAFNVSNVSSVDIRYYSDLTYGNYGGLGYDIDNVETEITDYEVTWKTKTVSLSSASTFDMWGKIANSQSAGSRRLVGWLIFS